MSDDERIAKWIERDPHKPSKAEAQVKPSFVQVWAIIGYWLSYDGNVDEVARA